MIQLLQIGDHDNIAIREYYAESEEEIEQIQGAPVGSRVLILTKEKGLIVKMLHSSGEWVDV